jgi:hypothetical protein
VNGKLRDAWKRVTKSKRKEENMAEAPKKDGQEKEAGAKPAEKIQNRQMGIRLAPVDNSDQPVVANYCAINVSPGMAFLDFGFLEPAMLAALPRMARSGGKLPERLNGKLAVRVALGYDALANLHQQMGQVLKGLSEAARAAGAKKD